MTKTFTPPLRATHHCRHYSYLLNSDDHGPRCARGLDVSGPGASRPCWPSAAADGYACDLREEYTEAEREAWHVYTKERTDRMRLIWPLIPDKAEGRGKSGTFECPACDGGVVRWSRTSVNGHVWAACSTPNCFSIIE